MRLIRAVQAAMLSTKAFTGKLSADQLRALSHEELLAYTLTHVGARPQKAGSERHLSETAGSLNSVGDMENPRKRRKEFDMSRYGQRLIALQLTYQGWLYHGFSSQLDSQNTVEHHLFQALMKTRLIQSRETSDYSRSGRTDVGVSSLGQVIGIRLRSIVAPPSTGREELDYVKVINSSLPDGIRILSWTPVSEGGPVKVFNGDPAAIRNYWNAVNDQSIVPDAHIRRPGEAFSARFDAVFRSYKYFFVRGALDLKAMQEAARFFEGRHDFRNFCRVDENVTNFERHVYTVEICRLEDDGGDIVSDQYAMYYIFVKGQAFLWHQVRCMAAVLFEVGMKREDPVLVKEMLQNPAQDVGPFAHGRPHYRMASPTPLLLFECAYPRTVLHFPLVSQSPASNGFVANMKSFERADDSLAQNYSEQRSKSSILHSILRNNESYCNDRRRNYIKEVHSSKHVPFHQRARDLSVQEKKSRAAQKNEKKRKAEMIGVGKSAT